MPRAPTYQPNQIAPAETTGARLRAADNDGGVFGALGQGLQTAGKTLGQYAEVQDKINAEYDDTASRRMATEAQTQWSALTSEFTSLQGGNALTARTQTETKIGEIHDKMLGQATTPRMRRMLEERLGSLRGANLETIGKHTMRELRVERTAAFKGQEVMFATEAANSADPAMRDKFITSGKAVIEDRLNFEGITDPAARRYELSRFASGVHKDVVDGILASPDPDIDMVTAYAEAHFDEMLPSDREDIQRALQQPLQNRQADSDFMRATTSAPAPSAPGEPVPVVAPPTPWAGVAVNVANKFGLSPTEVAAVISYETAGTFSPKITSTAKTGPRAGQTFTGLIQFGEEERRRYKISANSSPEEWTTAITGFLTDRGFKRGMSGLDLYSTINAGQPGRHGASDDNGKNTVRSHYDRLMREHTTNAQKWLGGAAGPHSSEQPREWDKNSAYDQIDTMAKAEGWSFERVERTKRRADQVIARDEDLLKRQRDTADEDALKTVIQLGDGFKSLNQLPRAVRDRLSPDAALRYSNLAEKNTKPKAIEANGPAAMTMNIMRFGEPDKFKTMNMADLVGKVSAAELDTLVTQQASMRAEAAKPDTWNPRSGIVTALNYGSTIGQLKLDDQDKAAALQIMETEAQQLYRSKGNKPLTEDEYQGLFRSATRKIKTTGLFGSSEVSRYDLTYSNVPDSARKRIADTFKKETGREASEDDIVRLFRLQAR